MPKEIPPPLSLALAFLRATQGWTQAELARAAGTWSQTICDYESGRRRRLSRETLDQLASRMGYTSEDTTLALLFLGGLSPRDPLPNLSPIAPSPAEASRARQIAARVGLAEASRVQALLLEVARARRVEQDRRQAADLWVALRQYPPPRQLKLVEESREFHGWALAELLCEESVCAAADDVVRALQLARMAQRVAALAPAEETWRSQLQGYTWAFIANAQRAGGDLLAAEESCATSWRLWRSGGTVQLNPLGEWRLHDLEASLRRGLRQFAAAQACLDRALAIAPAEVQGRILLNQQYLLEQSGDVEGALAVLERARPLVDASGQSRDRFGVRFNWIVLLCHLQRYGEAEVCLPELRQLAFELGNRLDLTRVLWLTGRIAAGRGRRREASTAFEDVRRTFTEARNGYDTALVTLELATLHLDEGRTFELADLAKEMVWIFRSRGVHREALAALRLFCQGAEGGKATAEWVRALLHYLHLARRNPELRFAG